MRYKYEELNHLIDEITEYEILINIAACPGMYVGDNRLDCIESFLNGFYMYKQLILKEKFYSSINYEMEKWLFFKESVSIAHAAAINSWSLMRRCYGNKKEACERFRAFIEETPHINNRNDFKETVTRQIYQIYSYYHWGKEIDNNSYLPIQNIKNIGSSYESIIPFVNRMILEPYNDLWIYLHYEQYFLQVRFLYYAKLKGWVDNTILVEQKNYYQDLIILHAYAALIQKEKDLSHIIIIHCKGIEISIDTIETSDYWDEVFNHNADKNMLDKNPISQLFSKWKKSIV